MGSQERPLCGLFCLNRPLGLHGLLQKPLDREELFSINELIRSLFEESTLTS